MKTRGTAIQTTPEEAEQLKTMVDLSNNNTQLIGLGLTLNDIYICKKGEEKLISVEVYRRRMGALRAFVSRLSFDNAWAMSRKLPGVASPVLVYRDSDSYKILNTKVEVVA